MKCTDFVPLQMKYFDHECSQKETEVLLLHVETCESCSVEFYTMKTMIEGLEAPEEELKVNEHFSTEVMCKVKAYEVQRQHKHKMIENIAYLSSLIICIFGISMWAMIFSNFDILKAAHRFRYLVITITSMVNFSNLIDFIVYLINTISNYVPIALIIMGIMVLNGMKRKEEA